MSQKYKNQRDIVQDIELALEQVKVGGVYAHYKNPAIRYLVKEIGFLTEDGELCVIYQAMYGDKIIFVRPLSVWIERVDLHGRSMPRFVHIES